MTRICLECATPKVPLMDKCLSCDKTTHTITGEARRPICHDCVNFKIHCQDGRQRSYLDYGKKFVSQASCQGGEDSLGSKASRLLAPKISITEDSCPVFEAHYRAPKDGRPNPLSVQQRNEIRQYLESPSAFWLDPERWDHVKDVRREWFWAPPASKTRRALKVAGGLGLGIVGLLISKKVDKVTTAAKESRDDESSEDATV